ncbi:MAG: hypothetical protein ACK4ZJ_18170, partial [Allorhizobium sp.]
SAAASPAVAAAAARLRPLLAAHRQRRASCSARVPELHKLRAVEEAEEEGAALSGTAVRASAQSSVFASRVPRFSAGPDPARYDVL